MQSILMLVEGYTEKYFVERFLNDHLISVGVYVTPKLLTTRQVKDGANFKGGIPKYSDVRKEVLNLLGNSSAALVTTFFDFAAIPKDFPRYQAMPKAGYQERVGFLTAAFADDIGQRAFLPYFSCHEFEALLFTDVGIMSQSLGLEAAETQQLQAIKANYPSPEAINEERYPSRRIKAVMPQYDKIQYGLAIIQAIGLNPIRQACPHFDAWLTQLEQVGDHA